jgi:hypothetical protein
MKRLFHIAGFAAFVLMTAGILAGTLAAAQDSTDSIEQFFQKAKQNYVDKNMNAASDQIKKGAAYMKDQAARASAKGKETLAASAGELEKLADDVKKGVVRSPKRIEDTFARAHLALAENEHLRATESWAQKKRDQAGTSLESANRHLEKSFDWAGQKIEKGTSDVMKKSEDLAQKLRKKGTLIADEVGKGLQSAGNEIDRLGKKISAR